MPGTCDCGKLLHTDDAASPGMTVQLLQKRLIPKTPFETQGEASVEQQSRTAAPLGRRLLTFASVVVVWGVAHRTGTEFHGGGPEVRATAPH